MHAAKIQKSDRLQRVYRLLRYVKKEGNPWLSTRAIIMNANVCAVNSIVAELRANGKDIQCKRTGNVWRYRLA